MVIGAVLLLGALFVAYANGANDNFKGVATLYRSGTVSYRTALGWATVTTDEAKEEQIKSVLAGSHEKSR